MSGFPSTAVVNIAHIHTARRASTAPILVNTTTVPGEVVLNGGAGNFTRNGIAVRPTTRTASSEPGRFYFNVHTTLNPGGVMRGQLVKQ